MLLRIEGGKLTALIYMGVNPVSRLFAPLYLKINRHKLTTEKPVDLALLNLKDKGKLYTAHGQFKHYTTLHGLKSGPLQIKKKGFVDLT